MQAAMLGHKNPRSYEFCLKNNYGWVDETQQKVLNKSERITYKSNVSTIAERKAKALQCNDSLQHEAQDTEHVACEVGQATHDAQDGGRVAWSEKRLGVPEE